MACSTRFDPDWLSSPGETLATVLEERAISPCELAQMLNRSPEAIGELLDGRLEVDDDLAGRLSETVGSSAEFWQTREAMYRQALQRLEDEAGTEISKTWLRDMPFRDMATLGWVRQTRRPKERFSECLRFFGVADVECWQTRYQPIVRNVALRTSATFDSTPAAVAAWLRQGEIEASRIARASWDPICFQGLLLEIRSLTREADPQVFVPRLQETCATAGVTVVVLKAPSGCRASGATRFINDDHPILLLSARHLAEDHFWFTFFHEAGHLILHGDSQLFLEFDSSTDSPQELDANEFAHNILVPQSHRQEFLQLRSDLRQIARFSRRIGVAPGVVVGQLQHSGVLKPEYLNQAKRRFEWDGNRLVLKR